MLQEELPRWQRFTLAPDDLSVLRSALSADTVPGGHDLTDALRAGLGGVPVQLAHKPGYAVLWVSDVIYVERQDTGDRFVVAAAAYGGRDQLGDALRHIGALLISEQLEGPHVRPAAGTAEGGRTATTGTAQAPAAASGLH